MTLTSGEQRWVGFHFRQEVTSAFMGDRSYWFGEKRYYNKRGYYGWRHVSTVKCLREQTPFFIPWKRSSVCQLELSECECVCVMFQSKLLANEGKQFQHKSQDQHAPKRGKIAKFSTKIFFDCPAHPNPFAFSCSKNFLCSSRPKPSRPGNHFPHGQELALSLISVILAAYHPAVRRLSTDVAKGRFAILFLAAFLFSLLRSDVSLQCTASVWTADVLERAVFLT